MGRTACTEPQCLYKGDLYLYVYKALQNILRPQIVNQQSSTDVIRSSLHRTVAVSWLCYFCAEDVDSGFLQSVVTIWQSARWRYSEDQTSFSTLRSFAYREDKRIWKEWLKNRIIRISIKMGCLSERVCCCNFFWRRSVCTVLTLKPLN